MYKAQSPSPVPSAMLKSFIDSDELEASNVPHSSVYVSISNGVEAVATMPRQPIRSIALSSASSSQGSMISTISEDKEDDGQPSLLSSTPLKRKKAIYRKSQTQTRLEVDDKPKANTLFRAYSMDSVAVPNAYSPNVPLTNFPTKKPLFSHGLVSAKSIKTCIGPLTKKVCEKLNMSLQLDLWQTKWEHTHLNFKIPDYTGGEEVFSLVVKEDSMLVTLKEQLVSELNKKHPNRLWSFIHECQFVYTLGGRDYQLLDDFQYICNTFLYQHFLHTKSFATITVRKKRVPTEVEVMLEDKIHAITKMGTDGYISTRDSGVFDAVHSLTDETDDEIAWAKLTLKSFAVEIARYRDSAKYSMMTELDLSAVTPHFAIRVPSNHLIKVFIHVRKFLTLERLLNVNSTAASILAEVLPTLHSINAIHSRMDNCVLQITGEETYIIGDVRLLEFKAIRRAIFKREDLHFSVVSKPSPFDDQLLSADWPLVDPLTGTAPTHDHLLDCINGISLWNLMSPLKVCIKMISNIPYQIYRKNSCNIELEIGMYVGGKLLREAEKISATVSHKKIVLDQAITFDINKSNIPKATRLMIVIKEDGKYRKPSTSANNNTSLELFWATISLVDYRNLLKVGVHEVKMWPTSRFNEKDIGNAERFSCDPNPIGPVANNSDSDAVKLTIEFEHFVHPVVFPNDVPTHVAKTRTSSTSSYKSGISSIFKVMSTDKRMVLNLPSYIWRVDWSDPQQVTEAYDFINSLKESLPLAVAFKLLDCDCPDEFVRAFAVERLRELNDDELISYLLQLVQALKFEINHDSALARFLLERALQNKLIGHFFFWHSRCEAQNPQYTARYDTLLEAYLVGCGKAMLDSIINQVSTLEYFQKITNELQKAKCHTASDSQKMLKQLLMKHEFSNKTVIPPYNPRMRYGNLKPEKCKVMQSKKMPMWLWMNNIHPSATQPVPYKMIVKSGDDLRQDMLTLQMLTLFDRIWQEDGLDLCLIPYGCVATGPNSGIIEVVKDAKTVADCYFRYLG
ncbi:phosphatidylinositol 4,5-bisphosphate 3-kinase catalytic subunit gamma isoform-like isoform X3 [Dysidea avara]|uniref:phosphatidylinositol 4,5-bisphosphate 3-kinase catalytic subunit gamma isoform-like isoform X3 n=1 Tax=Dysidea avara TaxID=196820 RepID=UPI0033177133